MAQTLSLKDAIALSKRMEPHLKVTNSIEFADTKIIAPDINFYNDDAQYFNSNTREIHIGVKGLVDMFHPEDEEAFLSALNYIRGHESQHVRSTASRPYALAIQKGSETILEYISSQVDTSKRRFRTEKDYENYANEELPKKGIYISWQMIQEIVAGIANSLEDGRIERIRSIRFPGFEAMRTFYRGIVWNDGKEKFKAWDEIKDDAGEKLRVLLNGILSLATTQVYQKGFTMAYSGTPMMDELNAFISPIGRAVMSGRTRGLIDPVSEICKGLAPYVFEVCRMSEMDAKLRKLLQQIIQDIMDSMLDAHPQTGLSEGNEDTESDDENKNSAPFEISVLFPEGKPSGKNESGDRKAQGSGSEGSEDKKDEDGEKKSGGSDSSGKEDEKSGSDEDKASGGSGSEGEEQSGDKSGNEKTGGESGKESENGEPTGSSDESADSTSPSSSDWKNNGESSQTNSGKSPEKYDPSNIDETAKKIQDAMKEAAERTRDESSETLSRVNSVAGRQSTLKEVKDTSKVVSGESVKDICENFIETKRAYTPDIPLPAVLQARGRTLRRKVEQYFRSLSTPNITYLDSGSIDTSRLFGLAMGDVDIFKKAGKEKKFDGCAYILIDNSGSMAGVKREEACKAAALIEEGFKGIFPFKIVAFDWTRSAVHEVVKGWDENLRANCCWNFCLQGRNGCGNEDAYDIAIASRELMQRPERKKLLVVLSDGTPGDREKCREEIRKARKQGIEVHGIYFEENGYDAKAFASMYEKDYVCCSLSELDGNLVSLIKKFAMS